MPYHTPYHGSKCDYRCSGQPRKPWATETLTKILTLLSGNQQQQHSLCFFDYLLHWVYSDRLCNSRFLISLWHESCAESCKRMSCSGERGRLCLNKHSGDLTFPWVLSMFLPNKFFCPEFLCWGNTVGQNEASVTLIKHQKHLHLVRSWQLAVMGGGRASVLGEQNSLMDEVITARSAKQRKVKSSKVLERSCSQVAT